MLRKLLKLRRGEGMPVLLGASSHFGLLASYYILRPIRDEIASNDRDWIPLLWTSVFFVMLVAVPLYGMLTRRMPRRQFIPLANTIFACCLLAFIGLLRIEGPAQPVIERVFYVWASVFNLFVIAVFWSFMADLFRNEQGRRLFGLLAVGGTLGAMSGGLLTSEFITLLGRPGLLAGSIALLMAATAGLIELDRRTRRLEAKLAPDSGAESNSGRAVEGSVTSGLLAVARSPYLLAICGFLLLYTFSSTFLYFQRAEIVGVTITDRAQRTQIFARADVIVNALTLFGQGFLVSRAMRIVGVGFTLLALPIFTMIGFTALGLTVQDVYEIAVDEAGKETATLIAVGGSALWVVIAFDIARRVGNFAFAKPAREVLFTLVTRQQKYQSKPFIDTVVYRGGDMTSGWIFAGLQALGGTLSTIAFFAVPFAALWGGLALLLGRMHDRRVRATEAPGYRADE